MQVIDFVENVVGEPAVLVGNSIGSLAALHVASTKPQSTEGIVLINCAGGMNSKIKRMPGDFDGFGWQYKAVVPIFNVVWAVVDFVLKIDPIARGLFDNVRGQERYCSMLFTLRLRPIPKIHVLDSSLRILTSQREKSFARCL